MTVIGLPKTLPPKSSTAICAAVTEPGPVAVAAGPDKSVKTPIRRAGREDEQSRERGEPMHNNSPVLYVR